MPALVGVIERYHQYFYDTLARGVAVGAVGVGQNGNAVATQTRLFSGQGLGNTAWTNMQIAGQFVADRTFQIKALRVATFFRAGFTTPAPQAYFVHRLYLQCQMQLYWTLFVGDKPMFVAGTHYIPLAAGIYGDIGSDTTLVLINNGVPSNSALLRLGRPIPVPPRQGLYVVAEIFNMGAGDHDLLAALNATDDIEKDVKYLIDGLHTREVQ